MENSLLTINAGSSSIKFALYSQTLPLMRVAHGRIERIGLPGSTLVFTGFSGNEEVREISLPSMGAAMDLLFLFLGEQFDFSRIVTIGHRVVHGMERKSHARVSPELIRALREICPIDPEHLPLEVDIIEAFVARYPGIAQVACFDTVFHADMPRVAQLIPLPRRFDAKGVRRYGFHGLSCAYILDELRVSHQSEADARVIIAHLGNGASITALRDGHSVDTSMGFTPTGGIPMSTRSGDLDPGALWYAVKSEQLSVGALNRMLNHESGLLGVSEISSDMHDLLDAEGGDVRAKEAVDLFCYEAKKRIGAYAAVLGGLDTLIFTGGMGENAPRIRARICENLSFLGIDIDDLRNNQGGEIISTDSSRVRVRVMRTNEELMMARIASGFTIQ